MTSVRLGRITQEKITLSVCSLYLSTGTGLAHPSLTKSAFPAAALEPRIWLTLAEHPGTDIYTLNPPTLLIFNPVPSTKISTGF